MMSWKDRISLHSRNVMSLLWAYKILILLAFIASICEYVFFKFGWVNSWWLGHFRYVWSQLPLHCCVLGCCLLFRRHGFWMSFIASEIYGLYILSMVFLCIELGNTWTEFWVFIIKETTFHEIIDFAICFWKSLLPITLCLAVLTFFSFRYHWQLFKSKQLNGKYLSSLLGVTFISPFVFWEASCLMRHGSLLEISTPRIIYAVKNVSRGNVGLPLLDVQQEIDGLKCTDDEILGVMLLGESATRNHFSCFGYKRKTTPCIEARGSDCICFDNIWAAESYTQGALTYMLSNYLCQESPSTDKPLLLTTVFQSLGSKGRLAYYSSQHLWSNDSVMYQLLRGASHAENGIKGNDFVLVDKLNEEFSLPNLPQKHCVILQGIGSHFPFGLRSDETILNHFKSDQYPPLVNEYDASVYSTDMLIDKVLDVIDSLDKPTWFLYVSDHGDTTTARIQRDPTYFDTWQVPFIVYFNHAFREKYPTCVQEIESTRHREFQTDVVFECICSLMGISWDGFNYENIPWNTEFVARKPYFPNGKVPTKF